MIVTSSIVVVEEVNHGRVLQNQLKVARNGNGSGQLLVKDLCGSYDFVCSVSVSTVELNPDLTSWFICMS